jgi:cyclase
MLKHRIIPTLAIRGKQAVKGQHFKADREVGSAVQAVKVNNMRNVDEMIIVDIEATPSGRGPNLEVIEELAEAAYMPLTIGGGITKTEQVRELLNVGADKVVIGSSMIMETEMVVDVARKFGRQVIVAALDYKYGGVTTHCGRAHIVRNTVPEVAMMYGQVGAGEILLTSIENEGTLIGYDTEMLHDVCQIAGIPVVAHGGCGSYSHMAEALDAGAHGVAAGAFFQFTDATPGSAANWLRDRGYAVR